MAAKLCLEWTYDSAASGADESTKTTNDCTTVVTGCKTPAANGKCICDDT